MWLEGMALTSVRVNQDKRIHEVTYEGIAGVEPLAHISSHNVWVIYDEYVCVGRRWFLQGRLGYLCACDADNNAEPVTRNYLLSKITLSFWEPSRILNTYRHTLKMKWLNQFYWGHFSDRRVILGRFLFADICKYLWNYNFLNIHTGKLYSHSIISFQTRPQLLFISIL